MEEENTSFICLFFLGSSSISVLMAPHSDIIHSRSEEQKESNKNIVDTRSILVIVKRMEGMKIVVSNKHKIL